MSSASDNGLPTATGGVDTPETGIVPAGEIRTPENGLVWMSYLWFVLGGAFAPSATVLSSIFIGYGACVLTVTRGERSTPSALFISIVAAAVASIPFGFAIVPAALVSIAAAYAVGVGLGSGKLSSGGVCLVCALVALALLGIDSSLATFAGNNLNDLALAQIDSTFDTISKGVTGISEGLAVARSIMAVLWPLTYTLSGVSCVIAAALGARVARTGLGTRAPRNLTLTTFDTPFWVAALLLASIVGLAVSQSAPSADALLMVSANVLMAVRLAFGADGVAVAAWLLRRRGTGIVATLVICALLVFIDMQFFVMAIVGLVDFWANFRRLPRGVAQVTMSA